MTLEEIFREAARANRLSRFSIVRADNGWQANAVSEYDSKAFHVAIDDDPVEAIKKAFAFPEPDGDLSEDDEALL